MNKNCCSDLRVLCNNCKARYGGKLVTQRKAKEPVYVPPSLTKMIMNEAGTWDRHASESPHLQSGDGIYIPPRVIHGHR